MILKGRKRRQQRLRKKVSGTNERPRLNVFKSNTTIYAQLIDDINHKTLLGESDLKFKTRGTMDGAKEVGVSLAKKAVAKGVKSVVFDRGGFKYHGKIKALADGAREGGLEF